MKFGLGLNSQSDWDIIIPKVKDIVVYKLFVNADIKSKMRLDGFNMNSRINLNSNMVSNKESYKVKSKLELKGFNVDIR